MFYNPYENIYDKELEWQKVNLHIHAGICIKDVCGEFPMREVIDAYAQAGYNAIAVTNHDCFVSCEERDDISLLDGVEFTRNQHLLLIGTKYNENLSAQELHDKMNSSYAEFFSGEYGSASVDYQKVIDQARKSGAFVILCHPNWQRREFFPLETMKQLTGYIGIEILNTGIYNVNNWGSGYALAVDLWDELLTSGKKVYGFGNDDFHYWRDLDNVCNMICAKSAAYEDIFEAVTTGRFYVSTGLELERFDYDGIKLTVQAKLAIPSYIDTFEYRIIGSGGKLLYQSTGKDIAYRINDSELYARVEVTGPNGEKLYTQPIIKD